MMPLQPSQSLQGPAFPYGFAHGATRMVSDAGKIEQDLRHLLEVRIGERPMLRTYGGGVHRWIQEPSDKALRTLARHQLETALRAFMPEVTLVAPPTIQSNGGTLTLTIDYKANPLDVVRRIALNLG
jgi:phage baseplate assembly protein W